MGGFGFAGIGAVGRLISPEGNLAGENTGASVRGLGPGEQPGKPWASGTVRFPEPRLRLGAGWLPQLVRAAP